MTLSLFLHWLTSLANEQGEAVRLWGTGTPTVLYGGNAFQAFLVAVYQHASLVIF